MVIAKVWYHYDKLAGKHAGKGEKYRLFALVKDLGARARAGELRER